VQDKEKLGLDPLGRSGKNMAYGHAYPATLLPLAILEHVFTALHLGHLSRVCGALTS
jgi:hypothetical protein